MRKFNKKIFSLAAIIGLGTITTCSTVITSCGASEAKNLTIDGVPTVIGTIINNAGSWSNSFKLLNDGKEVDNSKVEWKLFSNEPEENEEKDISFLKIENGLISWESLDETKIGTYEVLVTAKYLDKEVDHDFSFIVGSNKGLVFTKSPDAKSYILTTDSTMQNNTDPVVIPTSYTEGDITLPVTSIGDNFTPGVAFNQAFYIPDTITSIGNNFFNNAAKFNKELRIPDSVKSIGQKFMISCAAFNSPLILPSGIDTINEYFLSGCSSFDNEITIPDSVKIIKEGFLFSCSSLSQRFVVPSSVTSVGEKFLTGCNKFAKGGLVIYASASAFSISDQSFSTNVPTAGIYKDGLVINVSSKADQETFERNFPKSDSDPYRNIVFAIKD